MHRAQVFLLHPTKSQAEYFARAAGISRLAYNWALAEWKRQATEWWSSGKQTPFPTAFSLQKQFNAIKRDVWPWVTEVAAKVPENAIFAVGQAYDIYKSGQARYPKFKARGKSKDSFLAAGASRDVRLDLRRITIPKIGSVRMGRESRWPDAKALKVVISRKAGKWYAAVSFEIPEGERPSRPNPAVGIDLGIKTPIKLACGGVSADIGGNLAERLNVERRRLRRATKTLHRRVKGSGRHCRARIAVARVHKRVADVRSDFQHKATSLIANMAERVGVETLNVKGMLSNGRLARRIADVGFYEIRRQLAYKASVLIEADKWFPSSKTCSGCGSVKEKLTLADRTFHCEECGFVCDRDENAARNLERMAANRAVTARGDGSPARRRKLTLRSLSVKREAAKGGGL